MLCLHPTEWQWKISSNNIRSENDNKNLFERERKSAQKVCNFAENKDENPVKNRLPHFISLLMLFSFYFIFLFVGRMEKFAHLSFFSAFFYQCIEEKSPTQTTWVRWKSIQKMKFFHHHHRRIRKYWKESSKRVSMWEVVTWKRTRPRAAMAIWKIWN